MPVGVWKTAIAEHHPGGAWIRLDTPTIDALLARKARDGHFSFDHCVQALLEEGEA